jgi:hypothetical protein
VIVFFNLLFERGKQMSKTRLSVFLLVLLVLFVGMAVLAVSYSGDLALIANNFVPTGHACTSTCTI